MRLLSDLARLGVVGVVGAAVGAGLWPAVAAGLPLLLREAVLWTALGLGQARLLALLVPLDRLARCTPALVAIFLLVGALPGDQGSGDLVAAVACGAGLDYGCASVEVADGRARLRIHGPAVLDLPAEAYEDERVAMVLSRLVCGEDGRPLLTLLEVAAAFGKNHQEDANARMARFRAAGGSIAQMILDGIGGRPTRLHPEVRALLAAHWERNPLATHEETCRWLGTQDLPPDVPVPNPADLQAVTRLSGNLVLVRSAIARLLSRRGRTLTLALRPLYRHLLSIVDDQDRRLHEAGVQPAPLFGAVGVALATTRETTVRLSKTGKALFASLQDLVRSPSPEEDEELAAAVGAEHVKPLLWGVLYCTLKISMAQVGALVGEHKSTVCRGLGRLARCLDLLDPFPPAARFSGVLALDEKWVLIPKSFSEAERAEGKKYRYVHFAVDAHSGDLLHVDVFEASDGESVRAFLVAVRARGIRPRAVVTDMLGAYDEAIRETFGKRVVHHFCLFHHLQAVRHRLRERCGKDWNKHALLRRLVERVDHVYRCKSQRTARSRLAKVLGLRDELAAKHPEALPVLDLVAKRFPKVANAIGRDDIPSTNNVTERTIKALNRHYKHMAGFESLQTARHQVALFRFFYRLTPMWEAKRPEHRGLSPLDRAGWSTRGVPVADFVRRFTTAWDEDGPDALVGPALHTAPLVRAGPSPAEPEAAAA